jgi:hypothetical protein
MLTMLLLTLFCTRKGKQMNLWHTPVGDAVISVGKAVTYPGYKLYLSCLEKEKQLIQESYDKGVHLLDMIRHSEDTANLCRAAKRVVKELESQDVPEISILCANLNQEIEKNKEKDKKVVEDMMAKFELALDTAIEGLTGVPNV